jgi:hypothetical protein
MEVLHKVNLGSKPPVPVHEEMPRYLRILKERVPESKLAILCQVAVVQLLLILNHARKPSRKVYVDED